MGRRTSALLLSIVLIAAVFCGGCTGGTTETNGHADDKMIVAVSILPQADFVEHVGGEKVGTVVLIPPGASPATYEPTASQLRDISKADLYMALGSGIPFEKAWMEKIHAANSDMKIVNTSAGVDLKQGDPHMWLSPKQAIVQVENIYQALAQADPENKDYYYQNKEKYIDGLKKLDSDITEAVSRSDNRSFMVFHPAWGYYARDYGLEMITVEEEGKEPSPADIDRYVKKAKDKGITVVFVQPQFSQSSAKSIADEIGGSVVAVNPLARDYQGNMRNVTDTFVRNLK